MSGPSPSPSGLRADARRNHERILDATRAVIADIGPGFGVHDVATHAGVAVSTLYRRFSGRQDLVRAVFERYVADEVEPLVAVAVADPDPWVGLVRGLEATIVTVADNAALLEAARDTAVVNRSAATSFVRPLGPVLRRAQEAGLARADLTPDDLPALIAMVVTTIVALPPDGEPDGTNWRRYLTVLLDGMRADGTNQPLPP